MKHIYKRYQWRSPEGIKWTEWFPVRKDLSDNEAEIVLKNLKERESKIKGLSSEFKIE